MIATRTGGGETPRGCPAFNFIDKDYLLILKEKCGNRGFLSGNKRNRLASIAEYYRCQGEKGVWGRT